MALPIGECLTFDVHKLTEGYLNLRTIKLIASNGFSSHNPPGQASPGPGRTVTRSYVMLILGIFDNVLSMLYPAQTKQIKLYC